MSNNSKIMLAAKCPIIPKIMPAKCADTFNL